jgi:hypothetical protein
MRCRGYVLLFFFQKVLGMVAGMLVKWLYRKYKRAESIYVVVHLLPVDECMLR